jgi:hypothetical protein
MENTSFRAESAVPFYWPKTKRKSGGTRVSLRSIGTFRCEWGYAGDKTATIGRNLKFDVLRLLTRRESEMQPKTPLRTTRLPFSAVWQLRITRKAAESAAHSRRTNCATAEFLQISLRTRRRWGAQQPDLCLSPAQSTSRPSFGGTADNEVARENDKSSRKSCDLCPLPLSPPPI